jgi:hypothetical protein
MTFNERVDGEDWVNREVTDSSFQDAGFADDFERC